MSEHRSEFEGVKPSLPETRPDYVSEELWKLLEKEDSEFGARFLHVVEKTVAYKRAKADYRAMSEGILKGFSFSTIVEAYGGAAETERMIGTKNLEQLRWARDAMDLGIRFPNEPQ